MSRIKIKGHLFNCVSIIFVTLLFFVTYTLESCCDSCDTYELQNCQTNYNDFQEKVSSFTAQIIQKYLNTCHLVHLRYHKEPMNSYNHISGTIPTIEVNFMDASSEKIIQSLSTKKRDFLIRFQQQCIVYLISLQHTAERSVVEKIANLFTSHQLQIQSQLSYIVLNQYTVENIAKPFLFLHQLKNYPHRIWIDTSTHSTQNAPSEKFLINYFCYYCNDGGPAISSNRKIYGNVHEILNLEEIFPDVTLNFHGSNLRVTAAKAVPLSHVVPSPNNPNINIIEGMQANILSSIAKSLNFSYTIMRPSGGTGFKLANGTWTGIMGDILSGEVDIGLNVATTYERNKMIDFTVSVLHAFLVLVSTKPTPVFEWEAIFYPFKASCWIALLTSIFAALLIFRFLQNKASELEIPARFSNHSKQVIREELKKEKKTFFESLYLTVGALIEQGVPYDFYTVPARTFAIFWMLFAIIITTAYRSKLFAFLTFPTIEIPPSSFKELESSHYTWGMKSLGGVGILFVTTSPIAYVRSVGEKMEIYTDKYSCIDKTFTTRFTCIVYKAEIDYLLETRYWKVRRKVFLSDFVTPSIGAAWATAKYSPILPKLEERKYRTYETNLADRYLLDFQGGVGRQIKILSTQPNYTGDLFDVNTNYKNDEGDGTKPLEMVNLYGGFFILFFGIALSAIILCSDNIRTRKYKKFLGLNQIQIYSRYKSRLLFLRHHGKTVHNLNFNQIVTLMLPQTDVHQLDFSNKTTP